MRLIYFFFANLFRPGRAALWAPLCVLGCAIGLRALPLIDTSGTGGLTKNDCNAALAALARDSVGPDSAFRHFKLGLAFYNCQDYERAITNLRCCLADSLRLRAMAYELIGDIEAARVRPSAAATAYLSARRDSLPTSVQQDITEKLLALVKAHPEVSPSFPELAALAAEEKFVQEQGVDTVAPRIDSLFKSGLWRQADSLVSVHVDTTGTKRNGRIIGLLAAQKTPDSAFSTALLFRVAKAAWACKDFSVADSFLIRASSRKDFTHAIPAKDYALLRALVSYSSSHHAIAAPELLAFEKKYGPTPEVVQALARSNRALGNDSVAEKWYNRYVKLYPTNQNAPDVFWHLAWKQEDDGHFEKAASLYRRLSLLKRTSARCDEAYFRMGLCWFKAGKYPTASSTFGSFQKAFEESWLVAGAQYWKGKSLLAMGKSGEATEAFCAVVRMAPTDFYAFRAREALRLSGDTLCFPSLDSCLGVDATRQWIDSVSAPRQQQMSKQDSISYIRGTLCALCGLTGQAGKFFDGFETRYASNLGLQFDLAFLYKYGNDPTSSFRMARRLAWRIPAPNRAAMPLPLFGLMYPTPFFDRVALEGNKNLVDPFLVLSVMRQESVFDPEALSRSGAMGLMQIMPFTGRSVAQKLGESFTADSLLEPSINIRYGTFYLRQLLDQFKGNIVLALASYNGGPPKAEEWYAKNKRKTFDLFIEDIGFTETRGYVKKVLANYWTYRTFSALRPR
jgi:TolA-binding protein